MFRYCKMNIQKEIKTNQNKRERIPQLLKKRINEILIDNNNNIIYKFIGLKNRRKNIT